MFHGGNIVDNQCFDGENHGKGQKIVILENTTTSIKSTSFYCTLELIRKGLNSFEKFSCQRNTYVAESLVTHHNSRCLVI